MASKKEIDKHLKIALQEIGKITPWFDTEVNEWVFSHRLYPVEYGGKNEKEVIRNYPKYLCEFIKHRLDNRLNPLVEKKTKGWGGKRIGAGRPKGTKRKLATKLVRLNQDIAKWIEKEDNKKAIVALIAGEKILIPSKTVKRTTRL